MEYAIIGLALALNIIILIWKFRRKRFTEGTIDLLSLITVGTLFSGSEKLLIIGTIGSLIVSIYLLISPPKIKF